MCSHVWSVHRHEWYLICNHINQGSKENPPTGESDCSGKAVKVPHHPSVCPCSSAFCTRASHGGEAGYGQLLRPGRPADDPDWAELQLRLKGHLSGEESQWVSENTSSVAESVKSLQPFSVLVTQRCVTVTPQPASIINESLCLCNKFLAVAFLFIPVVV